MPIANGIGCLTRMSLSGLGENESPRLSSESAGGVRVIDKRLVRRSDSKELMKDLRESLRD